MRLTPSLTAIASGVLMATAAVSPVLAQDANQEGTVDQQFLTSLYDIMGSLDDEYEPSWMATEFLSPEENVEYAQLICQGLDAGMTPDDILDNAITGLLENPNLPHGRLEDAAYYAGATIPVGTYFYCPEHFSVIESWLTNGAAE